MGNVSDVYKSNGEKCLFTKQFDLWQNLDWNVDLPAYLERLNKIEDDRSYVILVASILELQIDQFLETFIPDRKALIRKGTSVSNKVNVIKAFRVIPEHFILMIENILRIRNVFAHSPYIDNFIDVDKSENLQKEIEIMKSLWVSFEDNMTYWSEGDPIRLMYKDICLVCLEGLHVFESNVKLFRQETEKREFIDRLDLLSTELREKRESAEKDSIRKNWNP